MRDFRVLAAQPKRGLAVLLAAVALLPSSCSFDTGAGPSSVEIHPSESGFELRLNGNPYFVRGAAGNQDLDALLAAGGNSIRPWNVTADDFGRAARLGLTVLAGIELGNPSQGFDYRNRQAVELQIESVRATVRRFREEPSLLMWALGDETASLTSGEERIRFWTAIDELAQIVKQEDPNHPVITVISGVAEGASLKELAQHCPSLDAVGVNLDDPASSLSEELAQRQWDRAYIVTALGPGTDSAAGATSWGAPIEAGSTTRARLYSAIHEAAVAGQSSCLGSYAALWGDEQRPVRSSHGMFLTDRSPTGAVDAMTFAWTGTWPVNRAPEIGPQEISMTLEDGVTGSDSHTFSPGATVHCAVDVTDPEGDALLVKWELVADTTSGAGAPEMSETIEDAVLAAQLYRAVIRLPDKPGEYRLFAYVYDSKGSAATANVPVKTDTGS